MKKILWVSFFLISHLTIAQSKKPVSLVSISFNTLDECNAFSQTLNTITGEKQKVVGIVIKASCFAKPVGGGSNKVTSTIQLPAKGFYYLNDVPHFNVLPKTPEMCRNFAKIIAFDLAPRSERRFTFKAICIGNTLSGQLIVH